MNAKDRAAFPELAKMQDVEGPSQVVADFLDWLSEQRIDLCTVVPGLAQDRWAPITEGYEKLRARYFGLDLAAVERERRSILRAITVPAQGVHL